MHKKCTWRSSILLLQDCAKASGSVQVSQLSALAKPSLSIPFDTFWSVSNASVASNSSYPAQPWKLPRTPSLDYMQQAAFSQLDVAAHWLVSQLHGLRNTAGQISHTLIQQSLHRLYSIQLSAEHFPGSPVWRRIQRNFSFWVQTGHIAKCSDAKRFGRRMLCGQTYGSHEIKGTVRAWIPHFFKDVTPCKVRPFWQRTPICGFQRSGKCTPIGRLLKWIGIRYYQAARYGFRRFLIPGRWQHSSHTARSSSTRQCSLFLSLPQLFHAPRSNLQHSKQDGKPIGS